MYVKKTESPANGKQIYIDGHRYRSIFQASSDTEMSFWYISAKLAENNGGFVTISNKRIVTEQFLLTHPLEILKIIEGEKL